MTVERFDNATLQGVFKKLKAGMNVGAAHILFHENASESTKTQAPLQVIANELSSILGLSDNSSKSALLYILSTTRIETTELSELSKFCGLLKKPCPPMPPADQPFLPYLSFITAPPRGKVVDKRRSTPRAEAPIPSYDSKIIRPPGTPRSHPTSELFDSLKRETNNGSTATLAQFTRALHTVDHTVDSGDIKELFQQCQSSSKKRQIAANAALVEIAAPTMALVRQQTSSSVLVQQSLSWTPRGRNPAAAPTAAK
jgi:hypothetical protein